LAGRLLDIWRDQQDAQLDGVMRKKLNELTTGGRNEELGTVINSDLVRGKKFSEMSTEGKAAFARLWDEAHNADRSYNAQAPSGEDLGPVQKKNPEWSERKAAKDPSLQKTVNANVAWGSLEEIGKAISALEDGSVENIHGDLLDGGSHKVPNFYNNILTPNGPGQHVTIDTHAVAAGLLRPLSGKSLEVAQNFGDRAPSSVISGTKGTYPIYADAYREAAAELGLQPRQLQSITWEGIRDIFPAKWKTAANVAKINDIWRQFEDGELTHDQAFDKIIEARGGTPEWSATKGERGGVFAEEDEPTSEPQELRQSGIFRQEATGRPRAGRSRTAAIRPEAGVGAEVLGQTAPLSSARRVAPPQ